MGAPAPAVARDLAQRLLRDAGPLLAEVVVPFVLVLYLALRSGGYGTVTSSEVGVIVWWLVLLGAVLGLLARGPMGLARWLAFALLGAFAAWTAVGFVWTESSEQTMLEVSRVLTYLGVLALALSNRGPDTISRVATGVGAAIAVVGVLALLSRLQPSWFPENTAADFLPLTEERLSYPLGYWNGLAALLVMGIPLALVAAAYSRHVILSALGAAVLPAIALAAFYTLSRGGALELVVALVVLLALAPERLNLLLTLAITGAGGAVLILIATRLDALETGLATDAAESQGNEMLAVTLAVCAAAGLVQAAIRRGLPDGIASPRAGAIRAAVAIAAVVAAVGVIAAIATGVPGEISDTWEEFKQPTIEERGATRFGSASGTGRYQNWSAALDATESEPLRGIGPGSYEFWWSRTTDVEGLFVRDAHSLYLETLGETGIIGFAILVAFLGCVIWAAISAVRTGSNRVAIAGAGASCAAFLTAAAIDWVWELPAVTVAFVLLAGALLATREQIWRDESQRSRPARGLPGRALLAATAVVALVVIAIPLTASKSIADSERAVAAGDLDEALEKAESAGDLQPYAATPSLQRAIVLELQGDLDAAAEQAREATRQESTNWQTWLVLSRLEARLGNGREALKTYRRARALNPQSPLFQTPEPG